jgi:hypothetical protein
MKEVSMEIDWRTVQFFISLEDGVSEVSIDALNPRKVRCSCRNFSRTARCKHTKFVKDKMDENDGHFSVHIPSDVSDEEGIAAIMKPDTFREFILKYGSPEVID